MPLLLVPVPTSLRRYKLVSKQCLDRTMLPMLYPQQTIFTTAIGHLELSSLTPGPHRLLTRQTFIVRHIHVHLSAEARLLSLTCPVAVARATLCPLHSTRAHKANEYQLPESILQPA